MKYKNRVRSRIANLKDTKNPNLRKSVLCGNIPPDRFAKMTAEVSNPYTFLLSFLKLRFECSSILCALDILEQMS